jgi:glycosyltransferase involved in cell wall biosynthesis
MKFTFVTSFYNTEKYIQGLYESLLSQTYTNWDWVVTDDFSDDNTKEKLLGICSKDRKVKYVEQSKKKEMFFNPHWFCKDSEIIVELGSDDLLSPKALEVYLYYFNKFPEVIMISCRANSFLDDGSWNNFEVRNFKNCKNLLCGNILYLKAWRNIIKDIDYNPGDWMEFFYNDLVFNTHLEEHGKVLILPRPLYKYRYTPTSISRKLYTMEKLENMMSENRNIISMVKERRGEELETIHPYFNEVVDLSLPFMDVDFSMLDRQERIGYFTTSINENKFKLIKELVFDQDVYLNKFDQEYEWGFYYIKTMTDVALLKSTIHKLFDNNSKCKVRVLVDKNDDVLLHEKIFKDVSNFLVQKYFYNYNCFEFCLLSVKLQDYEKNYIN